MTKSKFLILSFVFCFGITLIVNGQQTTKSEAELVETKKNEKYCISVLFYSDTVNEVNYLKIRNDKNGHESGIFQTDGESSFDVWSLDNEYLALSNGYDIDVYQASAVLNLLSDDRAKADELFDKLVSVDEISVFDSQKRFELRHRFAGWENRDSVLFSVANRLWNETTKNEEIGKFRYDFKQSKLYRQAKTIDKISPSEKMIDDICRGLLGENKKGVIGQDQIGTEP
jgi:hypothetical protein